jgi:hypothetical protein
MTRKLLAAAAAFFVWLGISAHATAQEFTATGRFDFNTVGDAADIGNARTLFAGAFEGTYVPGAADIGPLQFATIICPSFLVPGFMAGGYCIIVDDDGDRVFLSFDCNRAAAATADAIVSCEGDTRWIGGTGKFLGVAGGGTIRTTITAYNPDGTARGYVIRNEAYVIP